MKIFLSYPRKDEEDALILSRGLHEAGYNVWTYREHFPADDPHSPDEKRREKQAGIEGADIVIALIGPGSRQSGGFAQEIIYAQHRGIPVLPVIVQGTGLPLNLLETPSVDLGAQSISEGLPRVIEELRRITPMPAQNKTVMSDAELAEGRHRILNDDRPARVFIAYSRKQRMLARELSETLTRNGKAVFYDAKIRAGASWRQTIQRALDDATHLVVIWTPDAAESDEVEREVSYALAQGKIIVPILSAEISNLPYHLHGLQYMTMDSSITAIEPELLKAIDQFSEDEDIWQ